MHTKYHIGIDGGGSGTRVIIADHNFNILTRNVGAPSALGLGIQRAWNSITENIKQAFLHIGVKEIPYQEIAIGIGISGANNEIWKKEFLNFSPSFNKLVVDTDGFTTLLGAFENNPGVVIAIGTGSVGVSYSNEGVRESVSGFGFPSGDEASGSWLGMRACSHTEKCLDGRRPHSPLAHEILAFCKNENKDFLNWLGEANQNSFAKLAPLIFKVKDTDHAAAELLHLAGMEVAEMVLALDPELRLPLSICGSLGAELIAFIPKQIGERHQKSIHDSAMGALFLLKNHLEGKAHA